MHAWGGGLGYNRGRLRALGKKVPTDSMPPKVCSFDLLAFNYLSFCLYFIQVATTILTGRLPHQALRPV